MLRGDCASYGNQQFRSTIPSSVLEVTDPERYVGRMIDVGALNCWHVRGRGVSSCESVIFVPPPEKGQRGVCTTEACHAGMRSATAGRHR